MSLDDNPTGGIFDRDRPYNGQPHTDQGERGEFGLIPRDMTQWVKRDGQDRSTLREITLRDIHDAVLIGISEACGVPPEELEGVNDMYRKIDAEVARMDIVAAAQNASVEIEKRLGIYPNVPELVWRSDEKNGRA